MNHADSYCLNSLITKKRRYADIQNISLEGNINPSLIIAPNLNDETYSKNGAIITDY